MEFKGKIHIRELESRAIDIQAKAGETWITAMLETAAPDEAVTSFNSVDWAKNIKDFETTIRVEKMGSDYLVRGEFKTNVPTGCSRCGDPYFAIREGQFQTVLIRSEGRRKTRDDELDSGDPDFVFFHGDEIDLKELLREQMIIAEPPAECPEKDPVSEKCLLCGKNPNYSLNEESVNLSSNSTGQGVENSAFSSLSNLFKTRS